MTTVKIIDESFVRFEGDLSDHIQIIKMNAIIGVRITFSDGTIIHYRLYKKRWQARLLRKGDKIVQIDVNDRKSDEIVFADKLSWAFVSRSFADVIQKLSEKETACRVVLEKEYQDGGVL